MNKQTKVIILIDFLKNDHKNIIPVSVSLKESGVECKIIASDRKCKKHALNRIAANAGIHHGFLDDFCDMEKTCYFERIAGIYKKKLNNLNKALNNSRLFLFSNFSIWKSESRDFCSLIGNRRVNYILKRSFEFRRMLNMELPDLLIFSDEQSALGKLYALIASERRIPYLCLPDLGDQLLQNLPLLEFERTSRYAILGKGVQTFFRRQRAVAQNLFKTGSPLADSYSFVTPQLNGGEILSRLNRRRNRRFFLFTMQDCLPENKQILQALISTMHSFPSKYLIVRPHPASRSIREYSALVKDAGVNNVIFSRRFKINDLICASEIIITVHSLSGFHAIIKNKPLITINVSPFPDNMPYAKYGAALGVYKIEDLLQAMKSILNNNSVRIKLKNGRKRLLRDYPAYSSNISKNRIKDLAMSCIK